MYKGWMTSRTIKFYLKSYKRACKNVPYNTRRLLAHKEAPDVICRGQTPIKAGNGACFVETNLWTTSDQFIHCSDLSLFWLKPLINLARKQSFLSRWCSDIKIWKFQNLFIFNIMDMVSKIVNGNLKWIVFFMFITGNTL